MDDFPHLRLVDEDEQAESTELARTAPTFDRIVDSLMGDGGGNVTAIEQRREFVEYVAKGFGTYYAGLAVGWSEAQIRQAQNDPDLIGIIETIQEFHNDTVEFSILRSAQAGNVQAQKMYALAKMPERGWVEKRTHVIEGQARVDVVHSVREALQEALRGDGAIEGLHAAYIDTTTVGDAETD